MGFAWGVSAMRLATGSTSLREVDVASPMRVSNDVVAMRCDGCEIFDGFLKFRAELFRQRWFCKVCMTILCRGLQHGFR